MNRNGVAHIKKMPNELLYRFGARALTTVNKGFRDTINRQIHSIITPITVTHLPSDGQIDMIIDLDAEHALVQKLLTVIDAQNTPIGREHVAKTIARIALRPRGLAVLMSQGIVPRLMNWIRLADNTPVGRRSIVEAIANVARDPQGLTNFVESGVVPCLMAWACAENALVERAAISIALARIAASSAGVIALSNSDSVLNIMAWIQLGDITIVERENLAEVMNKVASERGGRGEMMNTNSVIPLANWINMATVTPVEREHLALIAVNIVVEPDGLDALIAHRAVPSLMRWATLSDSTPETRENVALAVANIACSPNGIRNLIANDIVSYVIHSIDLNSADEDERGSWALVLAKIADERDGVHALINHDIAPYLVQWVQMANCVSNDDYTSDELDNLAKAFEGLSSTPEGLGVLINPDTVQCVVNWLGINNRSSIELMNLVATVANIAEVPEGRQFVIANGGGTNLATNIHLLDLTAEERFHFSRAIENIAYDDQGREAIINANIVPYLTDWILLDDSVEVGQAIMKAVSIIAATSEGQQMLIDHHIVPYVINRIKFYGDALGEVEPWISAIDRILLHSGGARQWIENKGMDCLMAWVPLQNDVLTEASVNEQWHLSCAMANLACDFYGANALMRENGVGRLIMWACLDGTLPEIRSNVAEALGNIFAWDQLANNPIDDVTIKRLLNWFRLGNTSPIERQKVAFVIEKMSLKTSEKDRLINDGVAAHLMAWIQLSDNTPEGYTCLVAAIGNIADDPRGAMQLIEHDAISFLRARLESPDTCIQERLCLNKAWINIEPFYKDRQG